MEGYLTVALVLFGLGVLLLLGEILLPTGGIFVAVSLLPFAGGVGLILYYGSTAEAVVAIIGLAIGLPAVGSVVLAAWRKMSLNTVLDDPKSPPPPLAAPETEILKGRTGKTVSPMRPSGSVEFDGKRVDAMTEGPMLAAGVWVRCVDIRRGQVIVRQMEEPSDAPAPLPVRPVPKAEPPKADAPPGEVPRKDEPKKSRDDFDDFDIGLDKT